MTATQRGGHTLSDLKTTSRSELTTKTLKEPSLLPLPLEVLMDLSLRSLLPLAAAVAEGAALLVLFLLSNLWCFGTSSS